MPANESKQTRQPGRKRWLFRLLAAGFSTIIGVMALLSLLVKQERLVRDLETGHWRFQSRPIYIEEKGHELTGQKYLYDPVLGWRNIPGWSAQTRGQTLTINDKGLRGRNYSYEKPPGTKRILVLGDSFLWGYGVADTEVMTEVLQTRLDSRSGTRWEVLNTGVSGWGTDQEYLFLIDEGFKYSPDIVVLAFFIVNDPQNNHNSRQYGISKPLFVDTSLELSNVPVPQPDNEIPFYSSYADPAELTLAILEQMKLECVKRKCKFVVMKFGEFLHADPEYRALTKQIERHFDSPPETNYVDLDRAYSELGVTRAQLIEGNDEGHWNAFGHQITAELLHEFLLRNNLLDAD